MDFYSIVYRGSCPQSCPQNHPSKIFWLSVAGFGVAGNRFSGFIIDCRRYPHKSLYYNEKYMNSEKYGFCYNVLYIHCVSKNIMFEWRKVDKKHTYMKTDICKLCSSCFLKNIFAKMSSKLILIVSSYTVSISVRFTLRHSVGLFQAKVCFWGIIIFII